MYEDQLDWNCEPYTYHCDTGATVGIVFGVIAPHIVLPGFYYCFSDEESSFMRCTSIFNYFAFFPWLLALILFLSGAIPVAGWIQLLPIVLTPLTYVVVFLESCCSHEQDFLSEPSSEEETNQYIEYMRTVKPEISTHVECYHRERRTRTKRDSKGNTKRETYYVTVVTWRGTKEYDIPYWRDTSEPTPMFSHTCYTRLTLPDLIHFADTESLNHFEAHRDAFVQANRHRDKSIRHTTERTLPGLIKRRMVCGNDYSPPWWMSLGYYWLAVILHMTWPYRWKLNSSSDEKECHIVKEISCRPPTPVVEPSAPYPAPPYPSPYPGTDGQGGYWGPDPNAPLPNVAAQQMPPRMVYSRSIDPSLIMPSYGDDPPTYEEACGTGGAEEDSDIEGDSGGEHHTFSNEAYFNQQITQSTHITQNVTFVSRNVTTY